MGNNILDAANIQDFLYRDFINKEMNLGKQASQPAMKLTLRRDKAAAKAAEAAKVAVARAAMIQRALPAIQRVYSAPITPVLPANSALLWALRRVGIVYLYAPGGNVSVRPEDAVKAQAAVDEASVILKDPATESVPEPPAPTPAPTTGTGTSGFDWSGLLVAVAASATGAPNAELIKTYSVALNTSLSSEILRLVLGSLNVRYYRVVERRVYYQTKIAADTIFGPAQSQSQSTYNPQTSTVYVRPEDNAAASAAIVAAQAVPAGGGYGTAPEIVAVLNAPLVTAPAKGTTPWLLLAGIGVVAWILLGKKTT